MIIGHLKKNKTGQFDKTILLMLRRDTFLRGTVKIKKPQCNLGNGEGLQVSSTLILYDREKYIEVLRGKLGRIKEFPSKNVK